MDEKKTLTDIENFGCHIIHVLAEGDLPPFSYSVGIHRSSGSQELVVIGLKRPLAHFTVNEYNRRVRSGERFMPRQLVSGFIEGFECQFRTVHRSHYRDFFGCNIWFYKGTRFKVLQLVYPTTAGVWPWDREATEWFRNWQPLLEKAKTRVKRE